MGEIFPKKENKKEIFDEGRKKENPFLKGGCGNMLSYMSPKVVTLHLPLTTVMSMVNPGYSPMAPSYVIVITLPSDR